MNSSTKVAIYLIGLGMALTAFAYGNFATKHEVRNIHDELKYIREKVDKIHEKLPKQQ